MYVNLLTGYRTVLQKGGIIQEMLYRKCLVWPLRLPVLIQRKEHWMKNYPAKENSLWEWIYVQIERQSKSDWRKRVFPNA